MSILRACITNKAVYIPPFAESKRKKESVQYCNVEFEAL